MNSETMQHHELRITGRERTVYAILRVGIAADASPEWWGARRGEWTSDYTDRTTYSNRTEAMAKLWAIRASSSRASTDAHRLVRVTQRWRRR